MNKIYMFDVDGVLADFDLGYTSLAHRVFGTPIQTTVTQMEWNFRSILTNKEQSTVWDILKNTSHWWETLVPLVDYDTFREINKLGRVNDVYFITNRMHNLHSPSHQTRAWLEAQGIIHPQVVVTPFKGETCKLLGVDSSLEDNWGNACAIHWMSDKTRSFLVRRFYNHQAESLIPKNITWVSSVDQFLQDVE